MKRQHLVFIILFWGLQSIPFGGIAQDTTNTLGTTIGELPEPPTFSGEDVTKAKILAAFEGYRQAILNDQGEVAARFVAERTIQFYDSMAVMARTADSLQVDSLPLIDKLTVLILRARTPNDLLFSFQGQEVFIFAIDEGMVGKDDVRNNELGKIIYDEELARAMMVVNGQESPLAMQFRLEEGSWKIDLTSLFPMSNLALQSVIEDSSMTENEFIEFVIQYLLKGAEPYHALWDRPTNH